MGIRFITHLKYLVKCLLTVVYDDSCECVICKDEGEDQLICAGCKNKIKACSVETILKKDNLEVKCYSSAYYSNLIKEMILRLKYRSDFRCGEVLADMMNSVIVSNELEFDLITYVPSSKSSMKKRGFNQSEYLAKLLSEMTEKETVACLKKITETKDQIGLDSENRWKNLKSCFVAYNKKIFFAKRVLLIDDVITTGATVFHCAKQLLNEGCSEVIILTVAKSKI